ncbi:MAG TPA: S1 RNA-binding domain-containing protein [Thermoanaerobaculia bacterium]|nr:S1 RNA-binding domain-containing protein [Thermoanaerobaculia bacterium]
MDQSDQNFSEAFEASLNFKTPEQGDVLQGTIVSISGEDAFVSYGGPTEAVMSVSELEGKELGDTVEGNVISTGPIRISRKIALRKASLDVLKQAMNNGIPVEGKIGARNKGGFDVSVGGQRAFCPLSQIALGKVEDPDSFVGKTFEFKIIEMSDDGRKLVISRTALLKEEAAAKAAEARKAIAVGAVMTGKVKTIMPFGAFVDLGGVEGLLHVSEMSRRRVNDPKEIVSIGQEVTVKVIKYDESTRKISLSMKDQEPDPWADLPDRHSVGSQFTGKVVRATDFGLFVELEPGIDGLVHLSQLPLGLKANDPSLAIGSSVSGWVREVDPERRRLSLALREISVNDPWENAATKYPVGRVIEGTVERASGPGVFVQLEPGLTGLVPISELSVPPGADIARLHKPGAKLTVKIMNFDAERKRISLSHEAAKDSASHNDYVQYVSETKAAENAAGKSAIALAMERAMNKEK